jgi:hypothetical protein
LSQGYAINGLVAFPRLKDEARTIAGPYAKRLFDKPGSSAEDFEYAMMRTAIERPLRVQQ